MGLSEVEESCMLLDEKVLRFMEQLEILEEKRTALNSLIEQGWFSMSKARYSMGNKQVSTLQYASEIEPLVLVHTQTSSEGEIEFHTERTKPNLISESEKEVLFVENIGPQEGVRRRLKPTKDARAKELSPKISNEEAPGVPSVNRSDQNAQQDPLKWFGILVPQSLKQAQSSFKQVIELSAEIATLQTAVLHSRQELKRCLKEKEILQEEASAAQLDKDPSRDSSLTDTD